VRSVLTENRQYRPSMIALHWVIAFGIFTAFGVGLYMTDIPGITPAKIRLINWHKWLGVTLFLLVSLRMFIKLSNKSPKYPAHWGHRSIFLAKTGHIALYLMMFAVPVLGYLNSLAAGYPVVWFGVIPLPVVIGKDAHLKELFHELHEWFAWGLMTLVAGHVLMALKHHYLNREGILGRMIPGMRVE